MNPVARPLPFECAVTCGCDRMFHLPVGLLISPDAEPAHACVRCGHLTCTEVLWTHIHHNTYEPHGREEYAISEETRAWLDLWPRVLQGKNSNDYAYLQARTRCADVAEFKHVAALAFASRPSPRGRRLREAGIPSAPPPASLPGRLKNYRALWERNRDLTPDRDAAFLLANARPQYLISGPFAIDALLQRPDLPQILAGAASGADDENRESVYAIVREDSTTLPFALPHLLTWFQSAVSRPGADLSDYRLRYLVEFLTEQPAAATEIVPVLEAIKAGLDRRAFEFSRGLTVAIRVLKGEPPLPLSGTPWFFHS
jgi:hypothetical protein